MVLPRNYVEIEQEEMMYLDGGLYVSHSTVQSIASVVGMTAHQSIPAATIALKLGATFIAAKLAAIPGGNIIALVGAAYIVSTAGSIAPAFVSALMRRRGLDITVGWWYGLPQLSFSAR